MRLSRLLLSALIGLTTVPAFAEETVAPAQELERLSAQYKADLGEFEAQKTEAVSRLAKAYNAALYAGEKAIARERAAALKPGELPASLPTNSPLDLRTAHKTYREGAIRAIANFDSLAQRYSANYLADLAALQARAGNTPALEKRIAVEKEKASKIAATESRSAAVGSWTFRWGNAAMTRELKEDGTFVASEHRRIMGKWAISDNKVVLIWNEGGVDEMFFPINAEGMKGHASIDVDYIATKKLPSPQE